jgi:parvulin-like peptidyl-prolyl isomerase
MAILRFKRPKVTWRRLALGSLGAGAVAGALWLGRAATVSHADAAPAPPAPAPAPQAPAAQVPAAPASAEPSDYTRRTVAFIYGSTGITREQLGEYLIARFGPDKVLNLVNKLIIERYCAEHGITVTDAEVDVALADEVAECKVNRREFVEKFLREKRKSLYEWREDVLRLKLLMTKALQNDKDMRANEDDVRRAYESLYGEKVVCQAIMWPKEKQDEALRAYPTIRDNPEEFDRQAKLQNSGLAAVHGMMEPFGHYGFGDDVIEKEVFKLKEGEITDLLHWPSGAKPTDPYSCVVLKVVRRLPPDPTKKLEDVRPALEKEIIEHKIQAAMFDKMKALQAAADPQIILKPILEKDNWDRQDGLKHVEAPPGNGLPPSQQPVAYIYGTTPVTREQLGEYLIARYGADCVDLMVNKMIVEKECAARSIAVSEEEIEAALKKDIDISKAADEKDFIRNYLRSNRTTLYGYREDVLRPKLLLAKLARTHVQVEPDDLRKAAEAYHGERAECQVIMWPHSPQEHEIAIKQYARIRKSPEEFDRAARTQANPRLAAEAGRIPPFARHTTGNENVEKEVFALKAGEITPIIETPQGYVVARLNKRIPADKPPDDPAAAAAERAKWEAEIMEKKSLMQIPAEFAQLREAAAPNVLLRAVLREQDWIREVKQEISGTEDARPATKN